MARREVDHAHLHLAIDLAGLGIAEADRLRILAAQFGHEEVFRACFIKLEEGNFFAVGAPPEAVAQAEFFLIDPVKRAVDDRAVGAVVGQRGLGHGGEVHHKEVAFADEGHLVGGGVELGEHLKALVAVGDGREDLFVEVVDVVIALGIAPPDALGVGIEQHLGAVLAVLIIFDADEPVYVVGLKLRPVDEAGAFVGLQVVADQVAGPVIPFDVPDDGAFVGPTPSLKALPGKRTREVNVLKRQLRPRALLRQHRHRH